MMTIATVGIVEIVSTITGEIKIAIATAIVTETAMAGVTATITATATTAGGTGAAMGTAARGVSGAMGMPTIMATVVALTGTTIRTEAGETAPGARGEVTRAITRDTRTDRA